MKLTKNIETKKCKVSFRAKSTNDVIVTAGLMADVKYIYTEQPLVWVVHGSFFNEAVQSSEIWAFTLQSKDMALELDGLMKDNQKN